MDAALQRLKIGPFAEDLFHPGHNACPGCGSTTALRMVLNACGRKCVFVVPASCASLYFCPSDTSAASVPVIHTVFAGAFAEAEGIAYGLRAQGREENVVVWAGDGACYDMGFSGLSGAAVRDADILVVCNDNEGYQNTGGHQSSATPQDALMQNGYNPDDLVGSSRRKDLAEIMASHGAPYVATASAAYPEDLSAKVTKAMHMKGFRFILLLTPCVTWGYESRVSVKLARLAVETGYFPLYEVDAGVRYRITHEPERRPFEEFAQLQKRLRRADLRIAKREIVQKWEDLRFKASRYPEQFHLRAVAG